MLVSVPIYKLFKSQADVQVEAMVLFNPLMEGEKKYSPPRGMINAGMARTFCSSRGSSPDIARAPCPISGSNLYGAISKYIDDHRDLFLHVPRVLGLALEWRELIVVCPGYGDSQSRELNGIKLIEDLHCWRNWKPLVILLWYAANRRPRPC